MTFYSTDEKDPRSADETSAFYVAGTEADPSTGAHRMRSHRARGVWFLVSALGVAGLMYLHGFHNGAPVSQLDTTCPSIHNNSEFVWDEVR